MRTHPYSGLTLPSRLSTLGRREVASYELSPSHGLRNGAAELRGDVPAVQRLRNMKGSYLGNNRPWAPPLVPEKLHYHGSDPGHAWSYRVLPKLKGTPKEPGETADDSVAPR